MQPLQEMAALAAKYINSTQKHIFLTGKAGTGKTTFLKYIREHSYKKTIVAAPTGIAAINAGGVTLHSLLQLPFGAFVPENGLRSESMTPVNTPASLVGRKFNSTKRQMIRELELLIIDEVSMLRADLLDCIDHTLRYLRKNPSAFGGLQILFIGDLLQLPPVVKEDERALLNQYYPSPYFFDARALQGNPPIRVELQKVFRQRDDQFISLLNRLRHNQQSAEDLAFLNRYYDDHPDEKAREGYVVLTTHNRKAQAINESRLQALHGKSFSYRAEIEGEYPEHLYPNEPKLILKEHAQVMFIKNDPSGEGQFFNGKIATVTRLTAQSVFVQFEDGHELEVPEYSWENKRYTLEKSSGEILETYLGSYKQYPLRLAWAVTIHKSQGLTFEKAILDLSDTFAPGQLYVALSRLTSLDGLILSSALPENPPAADPSLLSFHASFQEAETLEKELIEYRKEFLFHQAGEAFLLKDLTDFLREHKKSFRKDENRSVKQRFLPWTEEVIGTVTGLSDTGATFLRQIAAILAKDNYFPELKDRLSRAHEYFNAELKKLEEQVNEQRKALKKEKQVKAYVKELEALETSLRLQQKKITRLNLLVKKAAEDKILTRSDLDQATSPLRSPRKNKVEKIPTAQISYELYQKGKSIADIASERGLVESTIEGHLAQYVEKGALEVTDFVSPEKLELVQAAYKAGFTQLGELKSKLTDDIGYGEIKMALAYLKKES
jgi:DNA-binding NarL/FixJ family response regulator